MEPIPTKPLLLSLIRDSNVLKQYIFDNIAKMSGCFVLRLLPYHCMLNPIEIVWSQMEQRCRRQKIFDWRSLQHENFTKKISKTFASHVIKEQEKFRKIDHIVDNEVKPVIIKCCSSIKSDSDFDVEQ